MPSIHEGEADGAGSGGAWCWSATELGVSVGVEEMRGQDFVQTGWALELSTTHPATVSTVHEEPGGSSTARSFDFEADAPGRHRACLPAAGVYKIHPTSPCVRLAQSALTVDTAALSGVPVVLAASGYRLGGVVKLAERGSGRVRLSVSLSKQPVAGGQQPTVERWSDGTVAWEYWAPGPGEYTVSPTMSAGAAEEEEGGKGEEAEHIPVLFRPASATVVVTVSGYQAGCPAAVPAFEAVQAKYVEGSTDPPVAGVAITVTLAGSGAGEAVAATALSGVDGWFRAGPVVDATVVDATAGEEPAEYIVQAAKAGYRFTLKQQKAVGGSEGRAAGKAAGHGRYEFDSVRLAEVEVEVLSAGTAQPVVGGLLTLSSKTFRRTGQTDQ